MLHVPVHISKQMRAFVVIVLSLTYHAIETLQLYELLWESGRKGLNSYHVAGLG